MTSLFGKPDLITLSSLPEQPSEDLLKAWENVATDKAESRLKVISLVNVHLDKRFKSSRPPGELTASELSQLVAWTNHNEFVVAYRNLWNENSLLQRQPEFMALVLYGIFGPFTPKIALNRYYPNCDKIWRTLGSQMQTLTARYEFIRKVESLKFAKTETFSFQSNSLAVGSSPVSRQTNLDNVLAGHKSEHYFSDNTESEEVSIGASRKLRFHLDTIGEKEMRNISEIIQGSNNELFKLAFDLLEAEGSLEDFQRYYSILQLAISSNQDSSEPAQRKFINLVENDPAFVI